MEKNKEDRRLYLLVFMDANGPGCSSGLTEVYVDNIEEFSKNYQRAEQDRERVSRFLRSKAGEIVTDHYSDDPELSIVQRVDVSVIGQKRLSRDNATVILENGFGWKAEYFFRFVTLDVMWIVCNGSLIKLVKPIVRGGCEKNPFGDFPDKDHLWHRVEIHGNPFWINEAEPGMPDWSATSDAFKNTRIESYVWQTAQVFENEEEVKKDIRKRWLTPEQLIRTFMDLPGDAG